VTVQAFPALAMLISTFPGRSCLLMAAVRLPDDLSHWGASQFFALPLPQRLTRRAVLRSWVPRARNHQRSFLVLFLSSSAQTRRDPPPFPIGRGFFFFPSPIKFAKYMRFPQLDLFPFQVPFLQTATPMCSLVLDDHPLRFSPPSDEFFFVERLPRTFRPPDFRGVR